MINDSIAVRRSYYKLNRILPVSEQMVTKLVKRFTELTPDAFNMKSARVVVVMHKNQDELWDAIYDVFGGKVARDKIDGFKAAYGTILYFYNENTVKDMQAKFPRYAENFPIWANQANGMLQFAIWCGLKDLGIGANLQHYNPVIDAKVKEMFNLPASWKLVAEMPFGGIIEDPEPKDNEDISKRVRIFPVVDNP